MNKFGKILLCQTPYNGAGKSKFFGCYFSLLCFELGKTATEMCGK
jgi:hypothetical protein